MGEYSNNSRKQRRREIEDILDDSELRKGTRLARRNEQERVKRLKSLYLDKENRFFQMVSGDGSLFDETTFGRDEATGSICLNPRLDGSFPTGELGSEDFPTMVDADLSNLLKPHQIVGSRFLWSHISMEPNGFGCILADFMGLGKTLQVITTIYTFLSKMNVVDNVISPKWTHVLVLSPTICLKNWEAEFSKWLGKERVLKMKLYLLDSITYKSLAERVRFLRKWKKKGGVMLMGYEMYRNLAKENDKKNRSYDDWETSLLAQAAKCICDPGPDLVVLDEGHRIRTSESALCRALNKMKTQRRILMTGYPLQNHLVEYWTMVNFARPNFLGSKEEFKNRFEDPIRNGQCTDSSEEDIRLARKRAYVLTTELRPLVLRRDAKYLQERLPPKQEWVLLCKLSTIQCQLYKSFLRERKSQEGKSTANVLTAYHEMLMIANHPDSLRKAMKDLNKKDPTPVELPNDFMLDEDIYTDDGDLCMIPKGFVSQEQHRLAWAQPLFNAYSQGIAEHSGKMVVFLEILDQSIALGDRVAAFSQSIGTIDMIIELLDGMNRIRRVEGKEEYSYLRIDGRTPQQDRFFRIQEYNDLTSSVNVMLVSTRAGGEGINLLGGNRIVIFDVCWNPSHDTQAMCRSYRFGQKKPVYVYRLISAGTMEKKVYDLQIRKEGIAKRIVDDTALERKFHSSEIGQYFDIEEFKKYQSGIVVKENEEETKEEIQEVQIIGNNLAIRDEALRNVLHNCSKWLVNHHQQESMFEEDLSEMCPEEERTVAMMEYEQEMGKEKTSNEPNPKKLSVLAPSVVFAQNLISVICFTCRQKNYILKSLPSITPIVPCNFCRNNINISSLAPPQSLNHSLAPLENNFFPINSLPVSKTSSQNSDILDLTQENEKTEKKCLEGKKILLIRRGITDSNHLRQVAEELGATFGVELNGSITHIVTCWTKEKLMRWLGLQSEQSKACFVHIDWLRQVVLSKKDIPAENFPLF